MIDFEAVRRAYYSPPPPNEHAPTVEERIAAYERQRIADGLTIYEVARAMSLSGSRTPANTHWVNQFATRPRAVGLGK